MCSHGMNNNGGRRAVGANPESGGNGVPPSMEKITWTIPNENRQCITIKTSPI